MIARRCLPSSGTSNGPTPCGNTLKIGDLTTRTSGVRTGSRTWRNWYGALYVVTEGWRALRFRDEVIGALLKDQKKVALLREYRAGAYHFTPRYFDRRFVALWERDDVIDWAARLHRHFDRWIREELPKIEVLTFPPEPKGEP